MLAKTITMPSYTAPGRPSRDDWTASNFHSCCDFKWDTVTVVKCDDNIFGGYTEESFALKAVCKS